LANSAKVPNVVPKNATKVGLDELSAVGALVLLSVLDRHDEAQIAHQ